ncbi:MAG: antibiotic biosynthesis monooxygenase [Roseateles depolymerans]|uniref:Antibiotic biosynthesis monooxygenase n=1 Tax=Roseateles depolymerans TaxID=76731 RepID=A0A2W5DSY1_9BURK|nr:MAG: antibiotic biosynthesis monooxygenase [Roseateles depolymerans]
MILEIADIRIHPGQQAAFEAALREGIATALSRSPGFIRASVQRGIESPERYVLQVEWETLAAHTEVFRGGPLFTAWRGIVGGFFAQPPHVEHFEQAV